MGPCFDKLRVPMSFLKEDELSNSISIETIRVCVWMYVCTHIFTHICIYIYICKFYSTINMQGGWPRTCKLKTC